ncbi:hypothetical protein, partial [Staphylococcus aureus]|uniref:hypothetical protein n=1 Tax=Staphylococcus aureus TaxID=1280 RepID=UPI0039BE5B0C
LEAGEDYNSAETKETKQKVRSDYEQSVDSRVKELEKQKADAERQLKEPKTHSDRLQEAKDAVQDKIDRIRTEIADRERTVAKEKLPLHEDVELGRMKEVEKALTSLRDKYLPEQPKMFADEKALKKR